MTSDCLYVMQSSIGHIKVGRSAHPERRRKSIEHHSGLQIVLLAQLDGRGEDEGELLHELRRYRLRGEWFENGAGCRRTIALFFGRSDIPFEIVPADKRALRRKLAHRRVRHTLKDGTTKMYSYPAYRLTKADKLQNLDETLQIETGEI
jgi:Meiotically Up-regulated Gene 113 (MUG113) protein